MTVLKHPFFKHSFIWLMAVDIFYAALLHLTIPEMQLGWDSVIGVAVWFVCCFWLPAWAAAAIILHLRARQIRQSLLEWSIACLSMLIGFAITNQVLMAVYPGTQSMGSGVIFGGLTWGSIIYFLCMWLEFRQKVKSEKAARKEAQLEALRYQLNPHFMFNSLNTISAYIHSDPDLADEVLHELADILRYSLDTAEQERVSLKQELDIIDKYLSIEQARFGNRLKVNFNFTPQLLAASVPPLLIQPIVENAIKHCAKQESLTIDIKIEQHHSRLVFTVKDNGPGFNQRVLEQGYGKGVGLKNIQQRVKQLPQGKMTLKNQNGALVKVEMAV